MWRSIEMQIALPRSQEVGKLQEQLQQRGPHVQQTLQEEEKVTTEVRRTQVNETDQNPLVQSEANAEVDGFRPTNATKNQTPRELQHPYLGNYVDYRS